jgi:hypothetical protein
MICHCLGVAFPLASDRHDFCNLRRFQLDLVRVQVAGKYLTGQPATWGEGDWNGAPGGQQGSPPPGDGQFNQIDIVQAQQASLYLTGPYAAIQTAGMASPGQILPAELTSVPEPASLVLALSGLVGLLPWRRGAAVCHANADNRACA